MMAVQLRLEGNAAFRLQDWSKSLSLYRQSLVLDSTSEASASAHCNSAAALIHLKDFDEALICATNASKLRPEWSKPWARLAEAHARNQNFSAAFQFYCQAIERAEDTATRDRYRLAAQQVEKESNLLKAKNEQGKAGVVSMSRRDFWYYKFVRLVIEQGYEPEPGGGVAVACLARNFAVRGLEQLDDELVIDSIEEDGQVKAVACTTAMDDIADAFLIDYRAFAAESDFYRKRTPRTKYTTLFAKMRAQVAFDLKQSGIDQYISDERPGDEIVKRLLERRKTENPDEVDQILAAYLSGAAVAGALARTAHDFGVGVSTFRRGIAALIIATNRWPKERHERLDKILNPTKLRLYRAFLMSMLVEARYLKTTPGATKKFTLKAIETLAREVNEYGGDSRTEYLETPVGKLAYAMLPRALALDSLAYCLGGKALQPTRELPDDGFGTVNLIEMVKAADYHEQASELLPDDYRDKHEIMHKALHARIWAGGLKIGQAFQRFEQAEQVRAKSEPIFGPHRELWSAFKPRHLVYQLLENCKRDLALPENQIPLPYRQDPRRIPWTLKPLILMKGYPRPDRDPSDEYEALSETLPGIVQWSENFQTYRGTPLDPYKLAAQERDRGDDGKGK